MNCWLLLYKHEHQDYLQHITGHFPEKHKARSDKGNPTIKHNSRKCGTVYFMHIQWQTVQIISWKLGKHLLFQLTWVSIFHCFKFIFWPTSSGTEEQVIQQQCPFYLCILLMHTFYLCILHQVFFHHFTQVFMTWEQLNIFVFVFSLALGLQSLCHFYKKMYCYSEMNGRLLTSWSPTGSWNLK